MSLLATAGPMISPHTAPHAGGTVIHRVAPPVAFYAGLIFIGMVVVWYWLMLQRHLAKCTCQSEES